MTISLKEKAMLVNLSISQWTARKEDKKVSAEVAKQYAATDPGRFNKVLIAQEEIKKLQKIANEARTLHYTNTLPWNDNGQRILTTANYFEYTRKVQDLKVKFNDATRSFCAAYPDLVNDARARLNGLFNSEDYPPIAKVERKYSFDVTFDPIPDAADFRLDIATDETARIQADLEKRINAQVQAAMADLWERLFKLVDHLSETLKDPGAKFKDSIIDNIVELCAIMPRLNLTQDADLETMRAEALNRLTRFEPEQLRPDNAKDTSDRSRRETARKETARAADDILKAMGAFYTPAQE